MLLGCIMYFSLVKFSCVLSILLLICFKGVDEMPLFKDACLSFGPYWIIQFAKSTFLIHLHLPRVLIDFMVQSLPIDLKWFFGWEKKTKRKALAGLISWWGHYY